MPTWGEVLGFLAPYAGVFGLGGFLGWILGATRRDRHAADAVKRFAERANVQIRTSVDGVPEPEPVRTPTRTGQRPERRTAVPASGAMYGPAGHKADRTVRLPAGARYVPAGAVPSASAEDDDDAPVSDDEYAARYAD